MDILIVSAPTHSVDSGLIARALAEHDAGMQTAANYKAAIETLARRKCSIAIVYSFDANGDLSITDAIRIMKQIVPDLLVIVVSEEKPLESERELRQAGLYYYLTTPFSEKELRAVLSGAIEKQMKRRAR